MAGSSGPGEPGATDESALHVVATAGHVDHGKSSLIVGLTGIDPDRLAEEKRRGLTIDLGFAWTTLPSGREVGFVDVPGHERFVRNMLAGVGPVRMVLFVVAADEGWRRQSEEHLQIVDVLGVDGAVVALTKADLLDREALAVVAADVRRRLEGTALAHADVVACSSATGEGFEDVRAALDRMVGAAPAPERHGRPRQFLDRIFSIRGAGTVATGTLTGGPLPVGAEVEILPSGHRARIRGVQTHKRSLEVARPVSRVAVNLVGTPKQDLERGDVLALPHQWRPTSVFEASLRPVRGKTLDAVSARGAYKVHVGSAERDARIHRYERDGDREHVYARIRLSRPVVLDPGDAFVVRDAGRRETVAGGRVLDPDPPIRPGPDPVERLRRRDGVDRGTLARRLVTERGAVRSSDVVVLTGTAAGEAVARGALPVGAWLVEPEALAEAGRRLDSSLRRFHAENPLREGLEVGEARLLVAEAAPGLAAADLADSILDHLAASGAIERRERTIRLPGHRTSTAGREDADRLIDAVRSAEPDPPTVKELQRAGFSPELIRATAAEGRLVAVSPEIVLTPELVRKAEAAVVELARGGMTVSAFRQSVGVSRKYAVPLLEYFDRRGMTRRDGDVRRPRAG
jgi:selenocysteine-specific elongation factor